jgi:Tol biopolymer transport system component
VLTGTEVDDKASLTPDGRLMAMTDWTSGDIAIRDMSTGQVQRLMAKAGGWESDDVGQMAVLSPDSSQVVYLWYQGGRNPYLRAMPNRPGAKSRDLVRNTEYSYVVPAAWSADGKSILVTVWRQDYTAQIAWVSVADGAIKGLRSLEWRHPTRPSLSPDGRYIAYSALESSDSADSHIYVLTADGARETEVVKTAGINEAPVWTPDGARLLFVSNRSGSLDLWSVPVRDGKAAGAASLERPAIGKILPIGIAPSGSFYYVRDRGEENVFIANIAADGGKVGGPAAILTENSAGSNRSPAWSPDGKFIAFKRRGAGNHLGYDLVVRAVATGEEKTYTSNSMAGSQTQPVWFHDGKGILLAMADNQNKTSYHRLDLKSGEFTEVVAPDPLFLSLSALSPDDKTVYIALHDDKKEPGGIVAVDLATGEKKPILTGFINGLALSPDGRTLAVARSVPRDKHWESHLSRVRVDGSDLRDLYTPEPETEQDVFGGGPMLTWTRDGRSILFGVDTRDWRLMRIAADGGQPEFTGLLTTGLRHDIAISPDGARAAFSHGKYSVKETWVIDHLTPVFQASK